MPPPGEWPAGDAEAGAEPFFFACWGMGAEDVIDLPTNYTDKI